MSCQTCRDNFDLIAVDELAGRDILRRYPDLFRHLIECQECRAAYLLLRETLRSESGEDAPLMLASPTPLLSSIQPPWRRVKGDSARLFPLAFEIARDFISRALRGPQLAFARGENSSPEKQTTLVLADLLQAEQANYVIEATIHRRIECPDLIDLEIRLVNEVPLREGLTVHVSWANIHRSAPVVEGEAVTFRDLPLSQLTDPQTDQIKADLALTFACE
ncbi:MAG: hypothetical protein PVI59_06085 [Anaerolineae bacterium]|jgi:hypothetical protein